MVDVFGDPEQFKYFVDENDNINSAYLIFRESPDVAYYYIPSDNDFFDDFYVCLFDCYGMAYRYETKFHFCFEFPFVAANSVNVDYAYRSYSALQETYDYNIQGWLTEQSSDLFGMKLKYYDPDLPQNAGVAPSYTGNITQWEWIHTDPENPGMQYNAYGFKYDAMSRMTENRHYDRNPANGQWRPTETEFSESGISYDKNGNIKTMTRRYYDYRSEEVLADLIKYEYTGNKLTSLYHENQSGVFPHFDYWADYEYDLNGNMTWDERKGLDFRYNYLNLLEYVFDDETGDWPARYKWLADGTKLQVVNEAGVGAGYMYLGSFIYSRSDIFDEWHFESTGFGGGRIIASETSGGTGSGGVGGSEGLIYTPYYHLTDHLGSVRTVFTYEMDDDNKPVPSVKSQNDYYPFGLQHSNSLLAAGSDTENRFLYNGKENQTAGLRGLLDYGARMYDPVIARWFNTDPLAEKYYSHSPYCYTLNNPIKFVDPDGRMIDWYFNTNGKYLGTDNSSTDIIRVMSQRTWDEHKSGKTTIDADIGRNHSDKFSEALISTNATAAIIGHFNETGMKLVRDDKLNGDFGVIPRKDRITDNYLPVKTMQVNPQNVHGNSLYDDSNNLKSSMEHEVGHKKHMENDPEDFGHSTPWQQENRAIEYQKSTPTWKKTTPAYRKAIQYYLDSHPK